MKIKLSFTEGEKAILKKAINNRESQLRQAVKSSSHRYTLDKQIFALEDIKNEVLNPYNDYPKLSGMQRAVLNGCVKECFENVNSKVTYNPTEWLSLSADQISLLNEIDTYNSIFSKCNYEGKHPLAVEDFEYRYSNTIEAISQLKQTKDIVLSKLTFGNNCIVSFIDNKNKILEINLRTKVNPRGLKFVEKKNFFAKEKPLNRITKTQAIKELSDYRTDLYQETYQFVLAALTVEQ